MTAPLAVTSPPERARREPAGRKLSVCFICPEYPPGPHGGVGSFTQVLGRSLVRAGHHVRCVGIYPFDYPAPDHESDQGVEVWRMREPPGRFSWVAARYRLYRAVSAWAEAGAVDIVEAPDSNGWFAGWPRLPVPLVMRANGSHSYFAHELGTTCSGSIARLERLSYRRADEWTAVSRHTADVNRAIFGLGSDAAAILYNPVEVSDAPPPFERRAAGEVVYTGTLTAKKGVIALVDAWPEVVRQVPHARLHVVGKEGSAPGGGPMTAYLLARLPSEMRDTVEFHGHLDRLDVLARLRGARVGIFPSFTEAFGIAPVESMASGCPTIYTRLTCGPEIVRDGVDGLLVDPREPAQLTEAMVRLLTDDALARRLGAAGRARACSSFAIEHGRVASEEFFTAAIERFATRRAAR